MKKKKKKTRLQPITITKGWRRLGFYFGAPVFTPLTKALRDREFWDTPAYTMYGRIFVRSQQAWEESPELRAHEYVHWLQEKILGRKRCDRWYKWCQERMGYEANPFESMAFLAGELAAELAKK